MSDTSPQRSPGNARVPRWLRLAIAIALTMTTSVVSWSDTPHGVARTRCTITGTPGNDRLHGTSGPDVICGLGGKDRILGFGGDDVLRGGRGADEIHGNAGKDHVVGGPGADSLIGGAHADSLLGGAGRDVLDGTDGSGHDRLRGRRGVDRCLLDPGDEHTGCERAITVPTTPTGLRGTATSHRVDLAWDESPGATGYRVYRDGVRIASVSTETYRDRDVLAGSSYSYKVAAFNAAGSSPRSSPHGVLVPPPDAPITVMAAGDIACDPADPAYNGGNGRASRCRQRWTAQLLEGADRVLTLGDAQYDCGGLSAYRQSYGSTWGAFKDITHAILSDEDLGTTGTGCGAAGPDGYFAYWGAAGGPQPRGYHSWNVGGWHFIALNSECSYVPGGCGEGSAQNDWLEQDLAASSAQCTIALLHEPRFRSKETGSQVSAAMKPFWSDLVPAGVEMILGGDAHFYERFEPQNASGASDPDGMVQWVVGVGGESHRGLAATGARLPNSATATDRTFGVLKLTLHDGSYDWEFLAEGSSGYEDSGSADCH
ncbi:MAG: hypothetical protein OEW66_00240 [Actinomycetota bacterium]|nr:hypothetical protein [Actinomycetota bacterium]